jgi:hypothetical protein
VKNLQGQKNALAFELEYIRSEKARLESAITAAKNCPQETLAQKLMSLKLQRPDLFTLSGIEQIAMLVKAILR